MALTKLQNEELSKAIAMAMSTSSLFIGLDGQQPSATELAARVTEVAKAARAAFEEMNVSTDFTA